MDTYQAFTPPAHTPEPNGRGPVTSEDDAERRYLAWAVRGRRRHLFKAAGELYCRYCGRAEEETQHAYDRERSP